MTPLPAPRHARVVIIGSGFGGIGMAIRLRQAGIDDFAVLERAGALGGVWRDNTYPGCACDVQSLLYEYSFAPNPDWTERYSSQSEIWAYLERCASDFGVRSHIQFGADVESATWDDETARWILFTTQGTYTADLLVTAVGALSEPEIPALPGLADFRGPAFHSARWDPTFDPAGKRVAVIGTGASAVQVVPAIQPVAKELAVFQRTPAWVVPRWNKPLGPTWHALGRRIPLLRRAARAVLHANRELLGLAFRRPRLMGLLQGAARLHLRRTVRDPGLRRALTPDYTIGCKRIMVSDDYFPALTRANVRVVPGPVTQVRAGGVVGADGVEHRVDAIVLCTGFLATEFPFSERVRGRGGQTLSESWDGSPEAHLGTTVHGFPNLFILLGPNTGLGHSSVVLVQEAQFEHVLATIRYLDRHGAVAVEPSAAAQEAFVDEMDRRMAHTVWMRGGCKSWYLDATGRNSTLWPGSIGEFRRRVRRFRPDQHVIRLSSTVSGASGRAAADSGVARV